LRLNKLDVHDKLLAGHKIIVPANPEIKTEPQKELSGQKKRKKPAYYTVKKGKLCSSSPRNIRQPLPSYAKSTI